MAATSQVGNYNTGTYNTTTATSGGSNVTGDSSTGFMDELFSVMNANAKNGADQSYSARNNDRTDNAKSDSVKAETKDVKKTEKTERDDSVESESAGEAEASEQTDELKSEDSKSSDKDSSTESDKDSEKDNDIEASDSQNVEGVTDGSNLVADVKQEFQVEAVTESEDTGAAEITSNLDESAQKSALDNIAQDKTTETENADLADTEASLDIDADNEIVGSAETENEGTEAAAAADQGDEVVVDELVTDEDTEADDSLITNKQQEKEVKAESETVVKAEETVKTEKTEVITAKDSKQDQKDQDIKQDDYKKYEYDYSKSSAAAAQHGNDQSGMNSRQQSQDKNYAFTDDIAAMSGMAASDNKATDVSEALGLDKTEQVNDVDVTRNVDNVVKSVKTMVQNGNSSMVVRLDPPELGQLNIKISSDSNGMSIEIQATNAKAQTMLQQNSNQLKSALENSGINVNNVDVSFKAETKNGANAGSDSRDSQQDFTEQQSGQNFSGQSENDSGESYRERFSTWSNTSGFQESEFAAETQQYEAADMAIDSWQELSFDTVDVTV